MLIYPPNSDKWGLVEAGYETMESENETLHVYGNNYKKQTNKQTKNKNCTFQVII